MPLARIDVPRGLSADKRAAIGEVVHGALMRTLDVPEHDHFQIIAEHAAGDLVIDKTYLGVSRSEDAIIIQVILNEGRAIDRKKAFYRAVADNLHKQVGLRREDVFISLVEVTKANWSFGNGEAQYA